MRTESDSESRVRRNWMVSQSDSIHFYRADTNETDWTNRNAPVFDFRQSIANVEKSENVWMIIIAILNIYKWN